MNKTNHLNFWLGFIAISLLMIYVLRSVMAPFVTGMILAYLLDPIADRLERLGISRLWATIIITAVLCVIIVMGFLILIPILQNQIITFANNVPAYGQVLFSKISMAINGLNEALGPEIMARVKESVKSAENVTSDLASWLGSVLKGVISKSFALVGVITAIVIVPVIAFYMLRDWDKMVGDIDRFLPRAYAGIIRQQMAEIDRTIAGFVRGQFMVCLALGSFYGIALSFAGLDLALVVGFVSGMLSFIPYVGTITGFIMSMGLAFVQFDDWGHIIAVFSIFSVGQIFESNYLTPKLVGDRVGLHPVWVIFALLAGGSLFGFVGVLLGVPVAAIIGVLIRYFLGRYVQSPLYTGENENNDSHGPPGMGQGATRQTGLQGGADGVPEKTVQSPAGPASA